MRNLIAIEPVRYNLVEVASLQEVFAEAMQEAPVDMSHLRLFTNDDAEEEKALVRLFLDQAHEMINIMQVSKNEDKRDAWKSAAHRFKGSSGNLGAMQLYHFCTLAEMHFEDNESQKLEMLTAIQQETQRVEKYFNL